MLFTTLLAGVFIFIVNTYLNIPEEMVYPVNIYALVLGASLVMAVQFGYSGQNMDMFVSSGIFFFVFSDFSLALSKFNQQDIYLDLFSNLTYFLAQYFTIRGIIFKLIRDKE